MTPSEELAQLVKKQKAIVAEGAMNLLSDLQSNTPVDTGQLKTAWTINPVGDGFLISNNMNYASYIFNGRRIVDGKMLGSIQMPDGVAPFIQKHNNKIQKRLDAL